MSVCLLVSKNNVNLFPVQTYLYRKLISYSLILIGPSKACVYRYTVKNILIGCHRQTNLHSTCLEPKRCHEEFTDGLLQKVLSGSTIKLGGIKNRLFFVIPFQAKLLFNVNGNTAVNMHVSTSSKAKCDLLITYMFANCNGKSSYICDCWQNDVSMHSCSYTLTSFFYSSVRYYPFKLQVFTENFRHQNGNL